MENPQYTTKEYPETDRKFTDLGLEFERSRADESMANKQHATERQIEAEIQQSRSDEDRLTTEARAYSDERGAQRAGTYQTDQMKDERNLGRAVSDEQLRMDRALADATRKQRRFTENSDRMTILKEERASTDGRLQLERQRADLLFRSEADQLVQELRLHEATKSAVTNRDEFLAIVSHDLRSPLGAIMMAADLMIDMETPDPELKELAKIVRSNAGGMLLMIADLLDAERIGVGKLSIEKTHADVVPLLRETIDSLTLLAKSAEIELQCKLPSVPLFANIDKNRITQVLSNLLSNALKFTPKGGCITVTLSVAGQEIKVDVEDSGPGIPANQLEHVFERYSQLKEKDRRGLGLGLYICQTLISAHYGSIWVDSEVGIGSCFHFTLPLASPLAFPHKHPDEQSAAYLC